MNTSGFLTPATFTIHSAQTILRSPVGEQSVDLPESTLKPVEQSSNIQSSDHPTYSRPSIDAEKLAERKQEQIDQQTIKKLSTLDREVRNHERAHAAVGGQYAGAPRYQYERGPDGVNYAVAGEVSISTSPVNGDPQMTIEKSQTIRRAALAPAEPSAQDRKVAAAAAQMEATARIELTELEREEQLEEQATADKQAQENTDVAAESSHSLLNTHSEQDETTETINTTQEQIFNEINNDLTAQLVSLGAVEQTPQSLGSIVSRFA